jgi:hypothetical protein
MPTADVKSMVAWVMRGMFGTDQSTLANLIFSGIDLGNNPGLLL